MRVLQFTDTVKRFGLHSPWVGIVLSIPGTTGAFVRETPVIPTDQESIIAQHCRGTSTGPDDTP